MTMIGIALFVLTGIIPFTADAPFSSRVAIAILGATILLALSPASTIAVIKETRAKGSFTKTVLGVTVTMDVIIIVLFAVAVAVASGLINNVGFSPLFAVLLVVDLGVALLAGYLVGKMMELILATKMKRLIKIALIIGIGYAVFALSYWFVGFSAENLPVEIHIEPLLVAMIGGFMVTNFTKYRDEFNHILHDVGPAVYVAFFTLTGVALKLDILLTTLPIAAALFVVRAIAIAIGSNIGGQLAGEPKAFNRYAWMGLITQAGIALGLAREVAVEFPALGDSFATLVISVVVLNEIFGPMLLKVALRRSGDAKTAEEHAQDDENRDVLIVGIEAQSLELARQLQREGWSVVMADTDRSRVERLAADDVTEHYIPAINSEALSGLLTNRTDAVVALLDDDASNLELLELARNKGVSRLIVRPNDLAASDGFAELGALVIDPMSAMVNLLDQSVRAPQSAAVLLHQDSGREMIQITVTNPDIAGTLLRDLRLPTDVLFMDVTRDGSVILPHGYTRLRLKDEVTLIGLRDSLDDAIMQLGY
jgi:Trk K+ transport system NAD-binding subunit/Kef-type K+ transport system membrane component KefB